MYIHLLIDYYKFNGNKDRQIELDTCFYDNINNESFHKVHVFSSDELPYNSSRVIHNHTESRLTYKDYFKYAEENISKDDIVVLANSDIYFDDSINKVFNLDLSKTVLALTRWCPLHGHKIVDNQIEIYPNHSKSQDVWIWKNPLLKYQDKDCEFTLGKLGCDNKIAYVFEEMGYNVINPSLEIITYHLHKEDATRVYSPTWLPGPFKFVPAKTLKDE